MRPARSLAAAAAVALSVTLGVSGAAHGSSGWTAPGKISVELSRGLVGAMTPGPGGTIYVGGSFATDDPRNPTFFLVGQWDGRALKPLPDSPNDGAVSSMVYDSKAGTLYVAGRLRIGSVDYGVVKFDGTNWAGVANTDGGSVSALALGPRGELYVGGGFRQINGVTGYGGMASLTVLGWSNMGVQFNDTVTTLAVDKVGNVYAGGFFSAMLPSRGTFGSVVRWSANGDGWTPLGATNSRVLTIAIGPGDVLYGHGNFTSADGADTWLAQMRLRKDAGSSWEPVTPTLPSPGFSGASRMTFTADGALILATGGRIHTLDSSGWQTVPGVFEGGVSIVTASRGGALLAGGSFTSVDGTPVPGLAFRAGATAPPAPTGVKAAAARGGILLTADRVKASPAVTLYRASCKVGKAEVTGTAQQPRIQLRAAKKGTYSCRMAARNSVGWGSWSSPVTFRVR